jgi:hypothetical protein
MTRIIVTVILAVLATSGCAKQKTISGTTYDVYGLLNEDEKKNPEVQYEVCWGNVIWGVLLVETIAAPIYFFGFALFEPRQAKSGVKGEVKP